MYKTLVPCPSCRRHVLAAEAACPFCAAALPADLETKAIPGATGRMSRAAVFVFGASLAVAGCSSETTGGGTGGTSTTSSSSSGGPDDDGGVMAEYGAPAPDAGPDDDGGVVALYGDPAPDGGPDAG